MLSMSEARESPEKKRRHNHESPERGKQQEEIVCRHVRIPRWVCEKVGPAACESLSCRGSKMGRSLSLAAFRSLFSQPSPFESNHSHNLSGCDRAGAAAALAEPVDAFQPLPEGRDRVHRVLWVCADRIPAVGIAAGATERRRTFPAHPDRNRLLR
jgi:hypothetical protein